MLKKRLIFTLLHSNGQFVLSRNFRLQNVGNIRWLQENYNFSRISYFIDELIVLDVSRGEKNISEFSASLKQLAEGCFVPIAAGGGIRTIQHARELLRSGADKVVINSALYEDEGFEARLASEFGRQCVVASIDVKRAPDGTYQVWSKGGSKCVNGSASSIIKEVSLKQVGELYINSMDRDGTGQGYDFQLLELLPDNVSQPVIIAGGVGNATHLVSGMNDSRVDAVATANLFNFVGDGLKQARQAIIKAGIPLPLWDATFLDQL